MIKTHTFISENNGRRVVFEINGKCMTIRPWISETSPHAGDEKFLFRNTSPSIAYAIGNCLIEAAQAADPRVVGEYKLPDDPMGSLKKYTRQDVFKICGDTVKLFMHKQLGWHSYDWERFHGVEISNLEDAAQEAIAFFDNNIK